MNDDDRERGCLMVSRSVFFPDVLLLFEQKTICRNDSDGVDLPFVFLFVEQPVEAVAASPSSESRCSRVVVVVVVGNTLDRVGAVALS